MRARRSNKLKVQVAPSIERENDVCVSFFWKSDGRLCKQGWFAAPVRCSLFTLSGAFDRGSARGLCPRAAALRRLAIVCSYSVFLPSLTSGKTRSTGRIPERRGKGAASPWARSRAEPLRRRTAMRQRPSIIF